MGFVSTNEMQHFGFEDCQLLSWESIGQDIVIQADALIVEANNSQNTNFTRSYADTVTVKFENGKIIESCKEGFRYLDANDVLVSETEDEILEDAVLEQILRQCKTNTMYWFACVQTSTEEYCLSIEFPPAEAYDTTPGDSFRIQLRCTKVTVRWERYLNRVQ